MNLHDELTATATTTATANGKLHTMTILPNRRLLMIDDNHAIHGDFRKVLCDTPDDDLESDELLLFGESPRKEKKPVFEIDSAFQGEEGVELLQMAHEAGRPYALAFVDVRMPPGIDGIETVARLWEVEPDLQVVICTAYSDYSWKELIGRLGHSDRLLILKKPFDTSEVLQLACALTEKWRLLQQSRLQLSEVTRLVTQRTIQLSEANAQLRAEIIHRKKVEGHLVRTQRLESIGSLASGLAHNLNNMLTPIVMGAPALKMDLPKPARQMLVQTIEESAQRAADIVRQLLTFASGAEGERSAIHAEHLIRELVKAVGDTFPKTISVTSSLPVGLDMIEADATQVHQILMNLCINARDAMPEGGTLLIEAANFFADAAYASLMPEAHEGPYVVMRVSDTGTGIPPESLDRIFDPFFSTKPEEQGSGLGLSTVAGVVRGHGGFVNVNSTVGKGSTFEIFLPALATQHPPASAQPAPAKEIQKGKGELILIVDDETGLRDVLTAILAEHGYRILSAVDGADALKIYGEHSAEISLVLTDIVMPVLDGVGLCRVLCRMNPEVRIIASTGEADASYVAQLRPLGVKHFLPKPYDIAQLLLSLREALR